MLTLENVSKTFFPGTVYEKKAITDMNLHINKGDFVTVIGANGSGKSTLFNLIAGTFTPDSGRITLDGEDITIASEHKRAKKIGRLFQNPALGSAPDMTIEENLIISSGCCPWLGTVSKKDKDKFREKIAVLGMGLEDRMDYKLGSLSGGQRQAVTLIMATYNIPKLLLLDEHTAALDPGSAEKIMQITNDIVTNNSVTCLMITHNMQSALDFGNRTLMMNDGKVIFDVSGESRKHLTVENLLESFRANAGKNLDNDRMLLS